MQPDIVYQSPQTAAKKNKFKPNFRSFKVVIPLVVIALVFVYFSGFSKFNLSTFFNPPKSVKTIVVKPPKLTIADFKKSMVKDIRSTFDSSKDAGVMAYVDLAAIEKDGYRSYQYYTKAFDKMVASYRDSKKQPISTDSASQRLGQKVAMIELKAYAGSLKYYKESDFVLPK